MYAAAIGSCFVRTLFKNHVHTIPKGPVLGSHISPERLFSSRSIYSYMDHWQKAEATRLENQKQQMLRVAHASVGSISVYKPTCNELQSLLAKRKIDLSSGDRNKILDMYLYALDQETDPVVELAFKRKIQEYQ